MQTRGPAPPSTIPAALRGPTQASPRLSPKLTACRAIPGPRQGARVQGSQRMQGPGWPKSLGGRESGWENRPTGFSLRTATGDRSSTRHAIPRNGYGCGTVPGHPQTDTTPWAMTWGKVHKPWKHFWQVSVTSCGAWHMPFGASGLGPDVWSIGGQPHGLPVPAMIKFRACNCPVTTLTMEFWPHVPFGTADPGIHGGASPGTATVSVAGTATARISGGS